MFAEHWDSCSQSDLRRRYLAQWYDPLRNHTAAPSSCSLPACSCGNCCSWWSESLEVGSAWFGCAICSKLAWGCHISRCSGFGGCENCHFFGFLRRCPQSWDIGMLATSMSFGSRCGAGSEGEVSLLSSLVNPVVFPSGPGHFAASIEYLRSSHWSWRQNSSSTSWQPCSWWHCFYSWTPSYYTSYPSDLPLAGFIGRERSAHKRRHRRPWASPTASFPQGGLSLASNSIPPKSFQESYESVGHSCSSTVDFEMSLHPQSWVELDGKPDHFPFDNWPRPTWPILSVFHPASYFGALPWPSWLHIVSSFYIPAQFARQSQTFNLAQ